MGRAYHPYRGKLTVDQDLPPERRNVLNVIGECYASDVTIVDDDGEQHELTVRNDVVICRLDVPEDGMNGGPGSSLVAVSSRDLDEYFAARRGARRRREASTIEAEGAEYVRELLGLDEAPELRNGGGYEEGVDGRRYTLRTWRLRVGNRDDLVLQFAGGREADGPRWSLWDFAGRETGVEQFDWFPCAGDREIRGPGDLRENAEQPTE